MITNNVIGIYLSTQDTGNDVRDNVASNNQISGILLSIDGVTGNDITHNTAQNNGVFDLVDDNANCDSNIWRRNTFGKANQTCIH